MKRTLYLSASVLTLILSGAAYADNSIETVVVTAEKRTEDLQKTAISADVISGADLQQKGVSTVDALQFIAPSVAVDNFGQGIDFNIRGIGKGEHNSQTPTGVITYRDGVPTFPGYIAEEPYYDVNNVQILRGPQGTFVGQNATGGAVFVTTNDPVIGGGYDGYAQAQFGNYSDGSIQGAVNIPISDTLALRVATYDEARGSFYSITNNGHEYSDSGKGFNPGDLRWATARVSLLWKPTSDLTVSLKEDFGYLDNGAYPADPFYQGFQNLPPGSSNPNPFKHDLFHIGANAPQSALDRYSRTALRVDYVLPDGTTIRSVSGYQAGSTKYTADLDGTDTGNITDFGASNFTFTDHANERILSQEIDVISPDTGLITWIFGGFAQEDTYDFLRPMQFVIHTPAPFGPGDYTLDGTTPYTSLATFGQVSLNLSDGLQFQLGARYSFNKEVNEARIIQFGLPIADFQSTHTYNISYKASVNWTINDDQFVYAFVSTGFKPGGLNLPVIPGVLPAPFKGETVQSFETGWKATWLDGHLRTQLDAYYNKYDNFQVTIGFPLFPVFPFEVNDPHGAQIYGVEGETQASFGAWEFTAGVGLMHSGVGKFFATDPRIASFTGCDPSTGPASLSCINLTGHPQTYAPDITFNLSGQYTFQLDDGDTLTPRANFAHESGQWATLFDNPHLGDLLAARNLLGAQLEWKHGDYVFTLYGTNLTDQHYEAALNSGLRFAGFPRQYGIRLMTAF